MTNVYLGVWLTEEQINRIENVLNRYEGRITDDATTADVIIGEPTLETIHSNKNLKWVQMTWAGTDKYTTKAALDKGGFPKQVKLTNASGGLGVIMSEYAIGAILSVYRMFPTYWQQQSIGLWRDAGKEDTLEGKRALLLGTGDIGSNLARKLKAFDVEVVGVRRSKDNKPQYFDEMYGFESIDELLPTADLVVCSLPNKPNTRGLLSRKRLEAMKKDAVLLNMGRGTLLDLDDLNDVLNKGHLRAAILDVFSMEPLPCEHPLWKQERAMLTPHIAGPSIGHCQKTQDKIVDICCENLERFFNNKELLHIIKREDFEY